MAAARVSTVTAWFRASLCDHHARLFEEQARNEVQRLHVDAICQLVALLGLLSLAAGEHAGVVDQAVDVVELLQASRTCEQGRSQTNGHGTTLS